MLNIVRFVGAVLEKNIFQSFLYTLLIWVIVRVIPLDNKINQLLHIYYSTGLKRYKFKQSILLYKPISKYVPFGPGQFWTQGLFFLTNLNLLVLAMLHSTYFLIWCSSSWEEKFSKTFPYILLRKSLSPWGAPC